MPPKVVLFAPTQQIGERARAVAADLGQKMDLVVSNYIGEAAISVAKEIERQALTSSLLEESTTPSSRRKYGLRLWNCP